ncbi:hypothetical protein DPU24_16410 [Salmonella enterica subsp. enterica serovar Oranienburg]|nr:hypothetical protein [Salmonella enterica subsp. enterica serovar Oranienburg]
MVTHAWLTDVLKRLPCWPEERLEELLPLRGFTFSPDSEEACPGQNLQSGVERLTAGNRRSQ